MEHGRRDGPVTSLNWNLLRTFVRVVELGSVKHAAEALFLVPSAVSTHVSALSAQFGAPLLERRRGKLVATPLGRELYDGATDLLARAGELDRKLRALVNDDDVVTVACAPSATEAVLPRLAAGFARSYPSTRLLIVDAESPADVASRLQSGDVDVAIVPEGWAPQDGTILPLSTDRLRLAVPAAHTFAHRTCVGFAELVGERFIMRSRGCPTRAFVEKRLGQRFADLTIALEFRGNAEIVACVEEGLGVALLPENVVARAARSGRLCAVDVADVELGRAFVLARKTTAPLNRAAFRLLEWSTAHAARALAGCSLPA